MFLQKLKDPAALLKELKQSIPVLGGLKPLKHELLVGLDVGAGHLKLLQINQSTTPYKVENYAISPIPAGAIVKDEIKDQEALGSVLREMFRISGIKSKEVALAIPRSVAIIKTITVDSRLNSEEIETRAWIEASRHFPDLVGDIYLDFAMSCSSLQNCAQLEIILVACRKEKIKPYLEVARLAGLTPVIVDINSYALERALALTGEASPSEALALLNLDLGLSTFIVVYGKNLVHAHDQSFDGLRLLTQVKGYLKDQPMEKVTASEALFNDVNYVSILKENLLSHLRHSVHFFYSSRPNISIQKIILSGDCANIPCLPMFISREISIETAVANPFSALTLASHLNAEEIQKHAPALMLCCGLALSKLE